jgi:two-component system chemotaxis sensor kinase CheA
VSDRVDLREFVAGFIAESDELVATASAALLEIEAANAEGISKPRVVRDLFRALHTIKGLAGMIGVEPIVELAHELETLVRAADRAGGTLVREAVDVSLRGVAAIADRVRAVAEQQAPAAIPTELVDAITAAAARLDSSRGQTAPARGPTGQPRGLDAALSPADRQQLAQGWRAGRRAWCVSFAPSEANAARGITIASVRARLSELGDIIKVLPRATPSGPASIAFDVLLTSEASREALAQAAATTAEQLVELTAPLEPGDPPAAPEAPREAREPAAGATPDDRGRGAGMLGRALVRVELARLDELQDQLSVLIVLRFRLEREVAALAGRGVDVRALRAVADLQGRQLRDLRRAILRARMVRVSEVLEPLALLVRSLGRGAQKEVRLELDTRDAELDKAVADRLLPAMIHLVRNAVDHAIEPVEERLARGKPRAGRVKVSCFDVGSNQLELVVEDDGRGIDRRKIAERAGQRIDDDASLLDVLTAPGFSTRDAVTRTSGRGLGMDIVRRIATGALGGELAMSTTPGAGTTFTLRVPLTIAVVDVFSFVCGRQTFVVPVSSVDEIFELRADQDILVPAASHARAPVHVVERRGQVIPLRSLATLLAIDGGDQARKAIVIRCQGAPVGFTVDRMLGRHEVVVRPVDDVLVKVTGIAGSADLGDGRPTLVLDLHALHARAAHGIERHAS